MILETKASILLQTGKFTKLYCSTSFKMQLNTIKIMDKF